MLVTASLLMLAALLVRAAVQQNYGWTQFPSMICFENPSTIGLPWPSAAAKTLKSWLQSANMPSMGCLRGGHRRSRPCRLWDALYRGPAFACCSEKGAAHWRSLRSSRSISAKVPEPFTHQRLELDRLPAVIWAKTLP